jgi:hypothetical protein
MATNTPFDSCFLWLIHEAMLRPDLSPTPEGNSVRLPSNHDRALKKVMTAAPSSEEWGNRGWNEITPWTAPYA